MALSAINIYKNLGANLTDSFTISPLAEKALPDDFLGRFREIISDPINLLSSYRKFIVNSVP